MNENRVVPLRQPDEIDDPLTEILRCGAKRLVQQAVEAEFAAFLARHADLELPDGRQRVVRHGHDPVRPIQTGIGAVEVTKPKARDRGAMTGDERIRYSSTILPKWARRTKSLDILLPALYLRGVSTGDFQDVLTALLGKDAPNLSPSVIGSRASGRTNIGAGKPAILTANRSPRRPGDPRQLVGEGDDRNVAMGAIHKLFRSSSKRRVALDHRAVPRALHGSAVGAGICCRAC